MRFSIQEFNNLIPDICSQETSSHPELWNKENPTQGHCAIVSVLAQELFGGEIVKVSLKNTPYENLKSHFFNIIDGQEIDFTVEQFGGNISYKNVERSTELPGEILSYPGTKERFILLKRKMTYTGRRGTIISARIPL